MGTFFKLTNIEQILQPSGHTDYLSSSWYIIKSCLCYKDESRAVWPDWAIFTSSWQQIVSQKVAQIFWWLFGLFIIMSLLCKKCVATFGQFQVKLGNFWFQRLVTLLTTNNNNGSGNWSQSSFFSLQVVSNFRLVFLLSIPSLSLNNFTWRDVSFFSPRRNQLEHVLTTLTSTKFKQVKQTKN